METIEINSDVIQLDQLLKWAGVVDSGGQVRFMLDDNIIKLNGVLLSERRKKVYPGDVVEIVGTGTWKVVKSQGE